MTDRRIVDIANLRGPMGDVTPAARQILVDARAERDAAKVEREGAEAARTGAEDARDAAEAFSGQVEELQDEAVSRLLDDDGTLTAAAAFGPRVAVDSVSEWWCEPVATEISTPTPRTVFGGISSTGEVLACEIDHATRETRRYVVGQAVVDDHNAPALYVEPGYRPIIAWTDHGADRLTKIKVGGPNLDLRSLVSAPLIELDAGGAIAYTQLIKIDHQSDEVTQTYHLWGRRSTRTWGYHVIRVDQRTGAVTADAYTGKLYAPDQFYVSIADAHTRDGRQKYRLAVGYNPANQNRSEIYGFHLEPFNGSLSSPAHNSWTGQQADLNDPPVPPILPAVASGNGRRLFYVRPGPDTFAVAVAEWPRSNPDAAVYRVHEVTGGYLDTGVYDRIPNASLPRFNDGFQAEVIFQVPADVSSRGSWGLMATTPNATTGGGTGFFLRFTSAGDLELAVYDASGTGHPFHSTTKPLAGYLTPGAVLGVKVALDLYNGRLRRYVSTDAGASWQPLGGPTDFSSPSSFDSTRGNNLYVPAGVGPSTFGALRVYRWALKPRQGTSTIIGVDYSRGERYGSSGGHGIEIFSDGSGGQRETEWTSSELGTSGPRVGYTDMANYIAGMGFENPSSSRAVYTAHSGTVTTGRETVRRWYPDANGTYRPELLADQPTSAGRLIRPYPPRDSYGRAGITVMRHYGERFTEYEGDWKTV
ncbi:hypothetical protein [Microbacterium sp. gxy059]|uniref:hypothetical protein n=1 Tax=Microbacterium sp. gxy059 TaxID=2957199 RepID=UPI003D96276E